MSAYATPRSTSTSLKTSWKAVVIAIASGVAPAVASRAAGGPVGDAGDAGRAAGEHDEGRAGGLAGAGASAAAMAPSACLTSRCTEDEEPSRTSASATVGTGSRVPSRRAEGVGGDDTISLVRRGTTAVVMMMAMEPDDGAG